MKFKLTGGTYLNSEGEKTPFETIVVEDGLIRSIDQPDDGEANTINCKGKLVVPTLTDLGMVVSSLNVIDIELKAAAAGGVGRVCLMPNTSPVNDVPAISKLIEQQVTPFTGAELIMIGAMTKSLEGKLLSEYAELKDSGCKALSNGFTTMDTLAISKRCFDYAYTYDLTIFMHPMVRSLYQGSMHSGAISTRMGLKGIPNIAETIAIAQLIMLAEASGVRLHLSNLSCEDSVNLVREAKKKGTRITADVAIANLCYTDEAVLGFNNNFHTIPPLRSERDRKALIEGVIDGTIDAITSAHEPRSVSAKNAPFAESATGISTIEHVFHYAMKLDSAGELALEVFIKAMNERSSAVLGLQANQIMPGQKANFSILNFDERTLDESDIHSSGKNTPLLGEQVTGTIEHTFVSGALVYSASS